MKLIVIDDDPISLFLSKNILEAFQNIDHLVTFESPVKGLNYTCNEEHIGPICILLDINMPILDGWEFLRKLEEIKIVSKIEDLKIYLLTSSIDERDKVKSQSFPLVSGFLSKPLTAQNVHDLLGQTLE